ncbi:hypothetical protein ACIQVE_07280 [Pseudomonas sp. NPDC098747]|uniref:hypothetical protein n=1 Tax=Pseudomonas sp. NPDC098747 TaxID=3364487 RepID=UPI00383B4E2F
MNDRRLVKMLLIFNILTFILAAVSFNWAYRAELLSEKAISVAESAAVKATDAGDMATSAVTDTKSILNALHDPSLEE